MKTMSTLRPARCLYKHSAFALKQSVRLAGVVVRRVQSADEDSHSGGDYRTGSGRLVLGGGSLALALLAADHVFNGAYYPYLLLIVNSRPYRKRQGIKKAIPHYHLNPIITFNY